jgi:tartrate/fumarate subfamily iron-sulfur-dependent hydro-lyase beta chain
VDLGVLGRDAVRLTTPLAEADVRKLKAGDVVLLSGTVFTGRDAVHQYLYKGGDLPVLQGAVIYHCGPVVIEEKVAAPAAGEGLPNQDPKAAAPHDPSAHAVEGRVNYRVVAAGPTTSIREEPYQAAVIAKYGVKAVIGKGGMGPKTLAACREHGCVYLHAIGGAAQIYARCVKHVPNVYLQEFGSPEAVWEMQVEDFPAVVTMDAHGRSLHQEVADESKGRLQTALGVAVPG